MYLVMLPCVLYVSFDPSFQRTYPFYRLQTGEPLWPRLVAWEIVYGVQFLALEFFFRGFLVHGTRRRFGAYSILVMTVPYCMVHFDKPLPETLGSIVAGLALGFMSLKTRSIWPGAAVHIAVAWTMDAAALYQQMR
jgi:membrane protease YdiL (CAAX protease family)